VMTPNGSSGERNIEKIKIMRAKSIFMKAIRKITSERRTKKIKLGEILDMLKNPVRVMSKIKMIMIILICPFLLTIANFYLT